MSPTPGEDSPYVWRVERKGSVVNVYRASLTGSQPPHHLPPYWTTKWRTQESALLLCHRWDTLPDHVRAEVEVACHSAGVGVSHRSPWSIRRIGQPNCHWTTIWVLVAALATAALLLRSCFVGG